MKDNKVKEKFLKQNSHLWEGVVRDSNLKVNLNKKLDQLQDEY